MFKMQTSEKSSMYSPTMATTKVCRLCGAKDVPFLNIFGTGMDLAAKIEALLFIEVKEWDDLPHKICFRCSTKLTEFHEFLQNCIKTQEQFSKLLGKSHNFKRDKNSNARKNWEAKLNKSKLSNEAYCDELVKKALESVSSLKLSVSDDKIVPKSILSKPSSNGVSKHPSCKKNIKIVLKRVDSANFPGIQMISKGKFRVLSGSNQSKPTEDEDFLKYSNLLQYKCDKCNEVIPDKIKATEHVCKIVQSKETPVNAVNPIKRSRASTRNLANDNTPPCDIINLDDDDCPETVKGSSKILPPDTTLSGNRSMVQGKSAISLNMLLPENLRDSNLKASTPGNNQVVPLSLMPNYCLVPMSDNTFALQIIPPQSQNNMAILQNSHLANFQSKLLSGGQFYQNNMNFASDQAVSQTEIGHMSKSNIQPGINNDYSSDLRSAVEMSQKYLCSLKAPCENTVIPETVCVERSKKRKSSGRISQSKKPDTHDDVGFPYPVSLCYRNTKEEHMSEVAKIDKHYVKKSNSVQEHKGVDDSIYTISPPKNAEKSVTSSTSKPNETSKPPKKRGHRKSESTPQQIKDASQAAVASHDINTQAPTTDGSFFTVVNVEPFFKPGNVPPMKICLKKSAPQVQESTVTTVSRELSKKSNLTSENASKKNDNMVYSCSICDMEFSREKRLLSHYKTHYEGFNDEEYL